MTEVIENDLFIPLKASSYHYAWEGPSLNTDPMLSWAGKAQRSYAPKRLSEWKLGRYCAQRACRKLGVELTELGSNEDRSPKWPQGIVGSISHTKGVAIALVSQKAKAVGVDIEGIISQERLERIIESFMVSEEMDILKGLEDIGPTLCFSAKETLYKAIRPLCGEYFGFHDAQIIEADNKSFKIQLMSKQAKTAPFNGVYKGGHNLYKDLVVTWLEIL